MSDTVVDYVLYAIEEDTCEGPALALRYDERGEGSPLVYTTRDEAESMIMECSTATGCYGDQRVIELVMSARFPEPFFCVTCGVWGKISEHAGHD